MAPRKVKTVEMMAEWTVAEASEHTDVVNRAMMTDVDVMFPNFFQEVYKSNEMAKLLDSSRFSKLVSKWERLCCSPIYRQGGSSRH
jgi:hypothetical protein